MASNKLSNQRRSSGTSEGSTAVRRPPPNYASEPEPEYGPLGKVANRAADYYERGEEQLRQQISGREGTAMLMALAGGLGVGLVLGAVWGQSHRQSQSWRDRVTAEGFGRRLMERIEGMLPDAIAEHFAK
jgi:hypothetical protein